MHGADVAIRWLFSCIIHAVRGGNHVRTLRAAYVDKPYCTLHLAWSDRVGRRRHDLIYLHRLSSYGDCIVRYLLMLRLGTFRRFKTMPTEQRDVTVSVSAWCLALLARL